MRRTHVFRAALMLAACCAMLLVLESWLRVFTPANLRLRVRDQLAVVEPYEGALPFVNRRGFRDFVWQREASTNSMGLRGRSLAPEDTIQKRRVLLLGDGVMFGLGLADDESPAPVLERLLGESFVVMNAAVPNYSSIDHLTYLSEFGVVLNPDVIVYGVCLNDPLPISRESRARIMASYEQMGSFDRLNMWLNTHSMAYVKLKDLMSVYRYRQGYMKAYRPLYNRDSWFRSRETLLKISEWSDERGIPLIMAVFPHRDQLNDRIHTDRQPQILLELLSHEAGFSVNDLSTVLSTGNYMANDPLHLTSEGMELAMTHVARSIRSSSARPPRMKVESASSNEDRR